MPIYSVFCQVEDAGKKAEEMAAAAEAANVVDEEKNVYFHSFFVLFIGSLVQTLPSIFGLELFPETGFFTTNKQGQQLVTGMS